MQLRRAHAAEASENAEKNNPILYWLIAESAFHRGNFAKNRENRFKLFTNSPILDYHQHKGLRNLGNFKNIVAGWTRRKHLKCKERVPFIEMMLEPPPCYRHHYCIQQQQHWCTAINQVRMIAGGSKGDKSEFANNCRSSNMFTAKESQGNTTITSPLAAQFCQMVPAVSSDNNENDPTDRGKLCPANQLPDGSASPNPSDAGKLEIIACYVIVDDECREAQLKNFTKARTNKHCGTGFKNTFATFQYQSGDVAAMPIIGMCWQCLCLVVLTTNKPKQI